MCPAMKKGPSVSLTEEPLSSLSGWQPPGIRNVSALPSARSFPVSRKQIHGFVFAFSPLQQLSVICNQSNTIVLFVLADS